MLTLGESMGAPTGVCSHVGCVRAAVPDGVCSICIDLSADTVSSSCSCDCCDVPWDPCSSDDPAVIEITGDIGAAEDMDHSDTE
mgnify:CR=1 FL=1